MLSRNLSHRYRFTFASFFVNLTSFTIFAIFFLYYKPVIQTSRTPVLITSNTSDIFEEWPGHDVVIKNRNATSLISNCKLSGDAAPARWNVLSAYHNKKERTKKKRREKERKKERRKASKQTDERCASPRRP